MMTTSCAMPHPVLARSKSLKSPLKYGDQYVGRGAVQSLLAARTDPSSYRLATGNTFLSRKAVPAYSSPFASVCSRGKECVEPYLHSFMHFIAWCIKHRQIYAYSTYVGYILYRKPNHVYTKVSPLVLQAQHFQGLPQHADRCLVGTRERKFAGMGSCH